MVPGIGFNSGKYDLNMVKEYFVKKIAYNKDDKCNEDVFAAKKENGLQTAKVNVSTRMAGQLSTIKSGRPGQL